MEPGVSSDLTDAPSGLGYSLLYRTVLSRLLPDGALGRGGAHCCARRSSAPGAHGLRPGRPAQPAAVSHFRPGAPDVSSTEYLATRLISPRRGADLVMREAAWWLRALTVWNPSMWPIAGWKTNCRLPGARPSRRRWWCARHRGCAAGMSRSPMHKAAACPGSRTAAVPPLLPSVCSATG